MKSRKQKAESRNPSNSMPHLGDRYQWNEDELAVVTCTGPTATALIEPSGRSIIVPTKALAKLPKARPTGPMQTCGDLPKKKARREKAQKAQNGRCKLVVVLVAPEEIREVHTFLKSAQWTENHIRLTPLMQGIARGYIMQP